MPTMYDVARVAGVSQMTVSRAFGDSAAIRAETRERVLKTAAEIGYFHNKLAAGLASRRTQAFGIVLPTLQDSIYLPMVDGARTVFEDEGADYILQTIDYARRRELKAIGSLLSQRVRALLMPSIGHTRQAEALLRTLPIPVIEVGNLPRQPIDFAVGHSDMEAGRLATSHLIAAGRRRIAILCGRAEDTTNARDRLAGYHQALAEAGLSPSPERIAEVVHLPVKLVRRASA